MPAVADRERVGSRDMVLGRTLYAADRRAPGGLHAMMVPARIAKGRLLHLDTRPALQIAGVVTVLTSKDFPTTAPPAGDDAPSAPTIIDEIAFRGQPVALVVAETLEAAIEGAEALRPCYSEAPFSSVIDSHTALREKAKSRSAGDASRAMATSSAIVDERYEVPTQHHNPIELIATSASWHAGSLTIEECSQGVGVVRASIVGALRLPQEQVVVRSEAIGGSFGQKGFAQWQTALVARAAMLTGRPVKLVAPRGQIFHLSYYRPRSRHHVKLGAAASGKMRALTYDVVQENVSGGTFLAEEYHDGAGRLYGISNYSGTAANVIVDRPAPGYMRGTHPHAACFAVESAVDELAYALKKDPVALRLANDTKTDPLTGRPLSARYLNECLTRGAQRFGWARRTPESGSMRLSDGTLVGWGVASGIYQASMAAGEATLRVSADGTTRLATSGHEMGQGIRDVIASTLRDGLAIDPDRIEIVIGDTSSGPQLITAGQWGTASVVPAVSAAVARLQAAFSELLAGRSIGGNLHEQLARLKRPYIEIKASALASGQKPDALEEFRQGGFPVAGPVYPEFTAMSYIAHFVEVHVEPSTGRVRMPRTVSVADCGRVISPRTARSQMYAGMVWALGQTMREVTEIDPRYGGYLNNDLADYVVPVNADVGSIEVELLDRPDPSINSVGAKGLGELVMIGGSAAIANAVFHATGRRIRSLPIRIEDLI